MSNSKKTSNKAGTSEACKAMDRFKMEAAAEMGVDLNSSNLTSRDAGSVGGQMVKKMIKSYEQDLSAND